jgi:chemotaxis protein MotB
MFDSGSPQMQFYSMAILENLAKLIAQVPNRISIVGHTDALPFSVDEGKYTNWELSADRANAARRALEHGGIKTAQIARVEGFADTVLFNENNPEDPINRRIAIIILKKKVDDEIKHNALSDWGTPPEESAPSPDVVPPSDAAVPNTLPQGLH